MRRFERGDQKQLRIGEVRVEEIPFDPKSRDDIPAVLRGLKALTCDGESRDRLFELLERHLGEKRDCDLSRGRRGMELWSMGVLALLKEGLNCDFDRLHHMANHDGLIRLMLGHTSLDAEAYHRQTLIDNVSLVTPQLIGEISQLVVGLGHEVVRKKPGAALSGRVDSFVVETDVAPPTDVRLLWDACRSALRLSGRWSSNLGVHGWRQEGHWQRTLRADFGKIRRARDAHRRPEDVEAYLALCSQLLIRLEEWYARHSAKLPLSVRERLEDRLAMGVTLLDQVREGLLEDQQIPAQEKMYSVFEPHTRWISKGKAGCPQELGVPVAILEDRYQFILGHRVLWEESDVDAALPLVRDCQEHWPELCAVSFDRGFHSPGNRQTLDQILKLNALPAKGRLGAEAQERENAAEFLAARKQHSAVESGIHHLECHGLDRVRTHGAAGFARTVALSILAANIHRLGKLLLAKDHQRQRRKRRTQLKAA